MKIRIVLFLSCFFLTAASYAGDIPLYSLIQCVETRLNSYTDYDTFSVSVASVTRQMNSQWVSTEEYYIEKKMTVHAEDEEEEIIKAVKKKKGEETDITGQVKEEQKKAKEKAEKKNKKKEENKSQDEDEENGKFSLDLKDILPFGNDKKDLFEFFALKDTMISERSACGIGVKVKEISDQRYKGNYYFDKETYDLLFVDVTPSKNPKFVKEFNIKMWFDLLDNQYLIMTRDSMRILAGFLIKKIRMEINETYSNYHIVPNISVSR